MTLWQLYVSPAGRISRSTFWLGWVQLNGLYLLGVLLDYAIHGTTREFTIVSLLLVLWPGIALLIKRCHDLDWSGRLVFWLMLSPFAIAIVELAGLLVVRLLPQVFGDSPDLLLPLLIPWACWALWYSIIWWLAALRAGMDGANRFGPDPLLSLPRQMPFAQLYLGLSGRITWSTLLARGFVNLLTVNVWALNLDLLLFGMPQCFLQTALILTLWPAFALIVKRCHDAGISLTGRCDPKRFGPDPREHGEPVDPACASPVDRAAWFMARLWFTFSGRLSRRQFWLWCWLPLTAIAGATCALSALLAGGSSILATVAYLLIGWAAWATIAKRCHDRGRPCWLLPTLLTPALLIPVAAAGLTVVLGWTATVGWRLELLAQVMGIAPPSIWFLWFLGFVAFRRGSRGENQFGAPCLPQVGTGLPAASLSPPDRIGRLTRMELGKLVSHKLFPTAVILTFVVTAALAVAAKSFTEQMSTTTRFSNYSLWIVSTGFGLQIGALLLVAIGALAMSNEATSRTFNTVLARPIRRIEFASAKILSLLTATVAIVLAAALAAFIVGGTVQERYPRSLNHEAEPVAPSWKFPSYGDIVDPGSDYVIASRGEVMGNILLGFALLVVPVFAGVSLGFLIGTLIDSAGLATGLSVGIFVSLEATKFVPMFAEWLGALAFNYPTTQITTLMHSAGQGTPPQWANALGGVGISAIYIAVCLTISLVVFCRRDITL